MREKDTMNKKSGIVCLYDRKGKENTK